MTNDSISDEDKTLFREHMRLVKPLSQKTKHIARSSPEEKPAIKRSLIKDFQPPSEPFYLSDSLQEVVLSETILIYRQEGLAKEQLKALRNGEIRWGARLDLHGFQIEQAREALQQFIRTQTAKQNRCLLIIHGKGGKQGAPPVIKNLINRWLPQFNEVLAFHSALPKDGGCGALYVLLKRNR